MKSENSETPKNIAEKIVYRYSESAGYGGFNIYADYPDANGKMVLVGSAQLEEFAQKVVDLLND